jgi:hypothetical protein
MNSVRRSVLHSKANCYRIRILKSTVTWISVDSIGCEKKEIMKKVGFILPMKEKKSIR